MRAYKLMLSIYVWSLGSTAIFNKEASILDKNMLKMGKITPLAKAAIIPITNNIILSLE